MSVPTRRLPQKPNLDQLRKQAKDLLDLYRSGDAGALSGGPGNSSGALIPRRLHCNDAQRVLARAYGFESWTRLKAFVEGATVRRLADAVQAGDLSQVRVLLTCGLSSLAWT